MAPEINIVKKLNDNFVQIDVETKKLPKRSFKVPETKADEFCKAYKQYHTDQSIWSPIRIITPLLVATSAVNYLARNLSKFSQWGLAVSAGIATAAGAIKLNTNKIIKAEDSLLQKHNAEEIIEQPQKLNFINKSK